jgi:hypothetical protein
MLTLAALERNDPGGRGERYLCTFPACARHQDPRLHRSMQIEPRTGLYFCHRCGATGMLADRCPHDRVRRSGSCARCGFEVGRGSLRPLREIMRESRAQRLAAFIGPHESNRTSNESNAGTDKVRDALRGVGLVAGTPGEAYLRGRGLELDAQGMVGFAPSWSQRGPAIVFACRDAAGAVVALQGRFLEPREGSPKAISVGRISAGIFATRGAMKAPKVAITEAPLDALSFAACGLPAIALFGCALGPERMKLLRRALAWRLVIVGTDADDAGEKAAGEIDRGLVLATVCRRFHFAPGVKDANEWLQRDRAGFEAAIGDVAHLQQHAG